MSRNEVLLSLPWASIVNLMCRSTEFKWLKSVSTCSFLTMLMTSSTYLFHYGVGMGH